jgi:predicted phage terminase large subunit-like protein
MEFPELKRTVRELASLWKADVVLIEDKSSGTQLIQELRAENFAIARAAPAIDGDKVMRLRGQTARIEGGFVLFPEKAHWLHAYLLELTTFPNSRNDDQVDSTVYALAWFGEQQNSSFTNAVQWLRLTSKKPDAHPPANASDPGAKPSLTVSNDELSRLYRTTFERARGEMADETSCTYCGNPMIPGVSKMSDGFGVWHPECGR